MGQIIGGITDAIGLTDHAGEKKAAAAAADASAQGLAMSKEQIQFAKDQLDFQKQQYKDFQDVYGDLQTNLGEYYKSLTPEKITSLGLQSQQQEFQQVDTQLKREFAQKGLSDSGAELAVRGNAAVQNATARATIRTNAAQNVAEQKLQFLGVGLGQGAQELGIIANSAGNVNNAFSSAVASRTSIAGGYLSQGTNLAVAGMQNVGKVVDTGFGQYIK